MKKLLILIGVAALLATVTHAQTNSTIQEIQGVGSTIGGWFTSENPLNRFQDAQIATGVINQNNSPVANEVNACYDLWRQHADYFPYTTNAPSSSLYLGISGRERTVQSGVMSFGGGPQFGWMQNDVRIGVSAEPLYRLDNVPAKFRVEFILAGEKMLTANSAIGLIISQQTHEKTPFIGGQFSVSFGNGAGFLGLFNKTLVKQ